MNSASAQWYCFLIDGQKARGKKNIEDLIKNEMFHIFGNDIYELYILGERISNDVFEQQSENYFFVKCKNYHNHIKEIRNSTLISLFLPNTNNPEIVEFDEIKNFVNCICKQQDSDILLSYGDIVQIKNGYLKNLYGIVISDLPNNGIYDVYFKFETRYFIEKMPRINLENVKNIFEDLKIPVKEDMEINEISNKLKTYIFMRLKKPVKKNRGKINIKCVSDSVLKIVKRNLDRDKK